MGKSSACIKFEGLYLHIQTSQGREILQDFILYDPMKDQFIFQNEMAIS